MLKLAENPTFTAPVRVELKGIQAEFAIAARLLLVDELRSFTADVDANRFESNAQMLERVVVGWSNVKDAADADVPFSPENLARLCQVPGVAGAMLAAFLSGYERAERGN